MVSIDTDVDTDAIVAGFDGGGADVDVSGGADPGDVTVNVDEDSGSDGDGGQTGPGPGGTGIPGAPTDQQPEPTPEPEPAPEPDPTPEVGTGGGGRAGDVDSEDIENVETGAKVGGAAGGGGRAGDVTSAEAEEAGQAGQQQRQERIESQQGVEDPDTGEFQGQRVTGRAQEFEQEILDRNPQLRPEDVTIRREGNRLVATLTPTGRLRDEQISSRLRRNISAPAGGFESVRGGTPDAVEPAPTPAPDAVLETADVSEPTGGFESVRGGTPNAPQPPVETETIGAAGPLGVTVPVDREPAFTGRDVIDAATRPTSEAPGVGVPSGRGQDVPREFPGAVFEAVTTQPEGPPGPGVLNTPPDARAFAEIDPGSGTFEGPVDVPEGAPGAGVGDSFGTAADRERLIEAIDESLAPREPVDTTAPEDADRVVGAAGPMGVPAPQDKFDAEDFERFVDAVDEAGDRVRVPTSFDDLEAGTPPERQPTDRPLFPAGGAPEDTEPVAEGILRDVETTIVTTEEAAGPTDAEIEEMQGLETTEGGERVTVDGEEMTVSEAARGLEEEALEENPSIAPEDVAVRETEDGLAVELTEAARQREERFGDFDPQVAGIAVEPTLRRASAGFRDVTGGFAEDTTDALDLEEGGFADVTAETALTTFPEIFNVPGLAVDTLEIAEAGAFAAEDPGERVPLLAEEAERQFGEAVEAVREEPALGVGAGIALAAQAPTSLATLRAIGTVSPKLMRLQDLTWNFPERTAKRLVGVQERPITLELRQTRRDILDALGRAPGAETRTVAFGGGEGPGQVMELRAAGRTLATAEAEVETESAFDAERETGGAERRLEEAQRRFRPEPEHAEIETRPEMRVVPLPETETAIRAEPELLDEAKQPGVVDRSVTTAGVGGAAGVRSGLGFESDTRLGLETDLGLETELGFEGETELERELELEREQELEQELEREQELEQELETELELERELEREFKRPMLDRQRRRPDDDPRRRGRFERRQDVFPGDPDAVLESLDDAGNGPGNLDDLTDEL